MKTRSLKPSRKYLSKLRLTLSLIALLVMLCGLLTGALITLDETVGGRALGITMIVTLIANLLWWVPAMLLSGPYYRSLSYEIRDDEVVVHAGIITKAVKHVPYRTVTNLQVNRGLLDRWFFDLGTLNIQTAGMSGATGAEESLVGLPNYNEVYELVAQELRRFRGSMAPTAADMESEPATLTEILSEVRAIRHALESVGR